MNNEVDSVALRAEASGRINVRFELIDFCAPPECEAEGLLINIQTKNRR